MTGLPDPSRSRAVLIGGSEYTKLPSLPAIGNNLGDLAAAVCDHSLWGLPTEHCVVVSEPDSAEDMIAPIREFADAAIDTLLVYYAGHGLIDSRKGDLLLARRGSKPGVVESAVPYDWVRGVILDSPAVRRIIILDCCYSGRALGVMADPSADVADWASVEGTYLLASAAENEKALAPPGETRTAFTGELLQVLQKGVPDGPELLDLDTIYGCVRHSLAAKSRPLPQKRDRNTAGLLMLVRNRAYQPPELAADRPPRRAGRPGRKTGKPSGEPTVHEPSDTGRAPATTLDVLVDRYEVGRLLGSGGIARVYEGRDRLLARQVALKILRRKYSRDPRLLTLFMERAQEVKSLTHPNIVEVYDTGEQAGRNFIVMEYVQGRTLRDIIRQAGPMRPERAAAIAAEVCSALAAAHARGIIHRDIKPTNVMLSYDRQVKVMDFGMLGSAYAAEYMSPEQGMGSTVDARSDLYSLGVCLFEMLTGRVPFTGETPIVIAYQHAREEPPSLRSVVNVPADVEAVVRKAMAKNPANRYQTAVDLREDLVLMRRMPA